MNYTVSEGPGTTSVMYTNVNNSVLLTGLTIYKDYIIFVRAQTVTFGNSSSTVVVSTNEDGMFYDQYNNVNHCTIVIYTTVPGTPNALTSSVINSSALFVSWTEPTTVNGIITSYDLYYSISTSGNCTGSGTSQCISSVPGQTTYNTTLINLVPFNMYALCVQASTRIGPGALTTAVVITTDPGTSSPPTNFTATAVSSTAIKLTWGYPETPQGLIAGYQIMHNSSLLFNLVNITISTNETSHQTYTFNGLIPYTAYFFSMRAFSYLTGRNVIYGNYSQQLCITTLQGGRFHTHLHARAYIHTHTLALHAYNPVPYHFILQLLRCH